MAPPGPERGLTHALAEAESGPLRRYSEVVESKLADGESAFWLLDRADFSFRARLALVDEAVSSLDIQYFIWERDPTSRLFSRRVLDAADRGIRVRLLLDDLTLIGHDDEFIALGKHPNIEVRTFNPFRMRSKLGRFVEFWFRWGALNHRMHNKIVVADQHFAITGGRNIGDRYFGTFDRFVQNDLDLMTVGPVVNEVSASFDLYWNSAEAYPLSAVARPRAARTSLPDMTARLEEAYLSERDRLRAYVLETRDWTEFLDDLTRTFAAGTGNLEYDLPHIDDTLPTQLYPPFKELVAQAREKLVISSPYFIPDDEFFELIAALERRGVRVIVLTNSLASNNHMIAHAAYKPWRKPLLEAGVELFESRHDSVEIVNYQLPPTEAGFLGLHTKAVIVDDRFSYVGSANVDPRSLIINTEIGFFIDSPVLADRLTSLVERDLRPDSAWSVVLDERGRLRWDSSRGSVGMQPALGFKQRIKEFFISLLPFKRQA
jgi:putative cardiolipin synthase